MSFLYRFSFFTKFCFSARDVLAASQSTFYIYIKHPKEEERNYYYIVKLSGSCEQLSANATAAE